MKQVLTILIFLAPFISNCQNFFWSHSALKPTVQTTIDYYTGTTSTRLYGAELSDGGLNVSSRGFCYSSVQITPTLSNSTVIEAQFTPEYGTGIFSELITGLTANTLYYWRAYETNPLGTSYGNVETFTTLNNAINVPTVTTTAISNIQLTSASSGGNVTSDGGDAVTDRGICWNTTGEPSVTDSITSDGSGTGIFTSDMLWLTEGTVYYVRAYATNSAGVGYGDILTFSTPCLSYGYYITLFYACDYDLGRSKCTQSGGGGFYNQNPLTIGAYYYYGISGGTHMTARINSYIGCGATYSKTILDADKKDTCTEVLCPD